MTALGQLLLLLITGAAFYILALPARAITRKEDEPFYNPETPSGDFYVEVKTASEFEEEQRAQEIFEFWKSAPYFTTDIGPETVEMNQQDKNLIAFLKLIRVIESNDNYNALVGGGTFSDFSDHPANLGWEGIIRSDGRRTTAAGAYQIVVSTWDEIAAKLGLPDFSPTSQDTAAIYLIKRRGAYDDILQGRFARAISKLTVEWEAFKLIAQGNYTYDWDDAKQIYTDAGGVIA